MLRIVKEATAEIVVRKSRFISVISHCNDADDLKSKKEKLCLEHPGAKHIVHAAIFSNQSFFSFSDDREPKGTAGLPTLDVLKGTGAVNVALFTIRYFGGILLGTGGLKRAYCDSAKLCVSQAEFAEIKETRRLEFTAGYQDIGRLKRLFKDRSAQLLETVEADDVRMLVEVEESCFEQVRSEIENILRKRI